jgi:uncharacterized protein
VTYEWDPNKRRENLAKHGVDFFAIESFEWEAAVVIPDRRKDYKEPRALAYAPIGDRLYCVTFTPRGQNLRIISLRKANKRERKNYVQKTTDTTYRRRK